MRTKLFCLTLCLALALAALPLALGEAEAAGQTRRLRLGSSIYTIEIDGSFKYGPVTEADVADGQIKVYSADTLEELKSATTPAAGAAVKEKKSAVKATVEVPAPSGKNSQFFKVEFGE